MNNRPESSIAEPLSDRELEILHLLAQGLSNREIAQRLILSQETIKWYNKRAYGKLGVSNRSQAVARASELGLLSDHPTKPAQGLAGSRFRLPAEVSTFIGRQQEMAEIKQLLNAVRLVTLTGPGGTGKTRLGLQVAESMAGFYANGVTFVSLATITDPQAVPIAIAHELGVLERPDRSLVESLQRFLADKQLLLLLDNFEQVLAAATLVTELLSAAPRLTVMATSREPLRLNGEHEYLVPPLLVPDPAQTRSVTELSNFESVILFIHRAQAVQAGFRLTEENAPAVAYICAHLDGLPLAIELAAARIKLLPPQQMLSRLTDRLDLLTGGPRDLPARQRTLRNTIDWSYDLLNKDEQRFFARLGVFTGGRSIEAVEAICCPGLAIDTLSGLESLLNKSLLYQEEEPPGEPRFFMLETIHEYARERLAESGEEQALRERHLVYFLGLAEEMEPGFRRRNQLVLLERTEAEIDNIRLAFEWALATDRVEAAARLIAAVDYFLNYKDRRLEGYRWFKRVLARLDEVPRQWQARFLLGAARLAWVNGDIEQDRRYALQALDRALEMGDRHIMAWGLITVAGSAVILTENYEQDVRSCEEGLAIFRELNDKTGIAQSMNILGELARSVGDYARAREVYEASMAASQETGEIFRQIFMLNNLSYVAYQEGDYQKALKLASSCLQQMLEIDAQSEAISALGNLAGPLSKLGEPLKAARLLGASAALMVSMGVELQPSDWHENAKYRAEVQRQLGEAAYEAAWAEGQTMTLEQAVSYALDHE